MNMQKLSILLVIALLVMGLSMGCTAEPVQTIAPTSGTTEPSTITTEPPTDPATEPATEEPTQAPTAPSDEERLAAYQALFSWEGDMAYHQAAGYVYTCPEEVDLYYLFYNGVGCPGSWISIAESEQELLRNSNFWDEMDIQLMPADVLEAALQRYFGVGLADVTIPSEWVYSPETDTYYSNHNDAYGCGVTVTGWEDLPDGNVRLHLTVDMVHDHAFEDVLWNAPMHMTLRPTDAGWQIVSNVPADE